MCNGSVGDVPTGADEDLRRPGGMGLASDGAGKGLGAGTASNCDGEFFGEGWTDGTTTLSCIDGGPQNQSVCKYIIIGVR